jgi:hypothetical protein
MGAEDKLQLQDRSDSVGRSIDSDPQSEENDGKGGKPSDKILGDQALDRSSMRVPAWCPQCDSLMKGKSTKTYYDWGVCVLCHIEFIEGREEKWKSGWRPTEEQIKNFRVRYSLD